jgi:hypothetical protein
MYSQEVVRHERVRITGSPWIVGGKYQHLVLRRFVALFQAF